MKTVRNILAILLMLCILSSYTAAFAQENVSQGESVGVTEASEADVPEQIAAEDRSPDEQWDAMVEKFLADHGYGEKCVTLGYYNLITGEEHYFNADTYMAAGSMYKISIAMYYCDKVDSGELAWDSLVGGYKLETALSQMIVHSDNNIAQMLWKKVGTWRQFRTATAPYFDVDPENVDGYYFKDNYLTPTQIIAMLQKVYENIDGKYEKIYRYMCEAEPEKYFNQHEQAYELGHKYGWIELEGSLYINDCAIVNTEEPIAIVMFTKAASKPTAALADYCTAASEFCQSIIEAEKAAKEEAERLEREKAEAEEAARIAEEKAKEAEEAAKAAEEKARIEAEEAEKAQQAAELEAKRLAIQAKEQEMTEALFVVIAAAAVVGIIIVIIFGIKKKMNAFWGMLTVLLFALALMLCSVSDKMGLLYAVPNGDPGETVTVFMNSVISGEYDRAYECVENYSSLGLENLPDSEEGKLIYDALRESYSYSFDGKCNVDKLTASASVEFTYLDTELMAADLSAAADEALPALLEKHSDIEVYDADKNYLESFTDEVYRTALTSVLENSEKYYTTKTLTFDLSYFSGEWHIELNNDIINAISGGTAY